VSGSRVGVTGGTSPGQSKRAVISLKEKTSLNENFAQQKSHSAGASFAVFVASLLLYSTATYGAGLRRRAIIETGLAGINKSVLRRNNESGGVIGR
jgi:hypothetical protein